MSLDKIAKVLECDEATVVKEASRMGLNEVVYDPRWEMKGFITIVRANWYLLPYEQLMTLLKQYQCQGINGVYPFQSRSFANEVLVL